MLRNYFKVALRNLRHSKLYSFINIAGLSLGIASCTVIFLYVQQELSYDRYNEKADRIFRLTEVLHLPKEDNSRAVTSPPMAPKLKAAFPEIEKAVRLSYSGRNLSYQDRKIYDAAIMYADSTLFDV
ncbi:MAG: ABC transporter permease, partial [Bacteroidota bacterium]